MSDTPKSLLSAVRYYSDLDRCEQKMIRMRWEGGQPECPHCGCNNVGRIETRRLFKCRNRDCRKQFSVKVGTIFEDSPLGLDKWFVAVWCIANCKNGISSHELARTLEITQKSAWHMLHRIREAMRTGSFRKMQGEIEADETYVGGKSENMHAARRREVVKGRGPDHMTAVQGILQRGGEVRTYVVPKVDADRLQGNVVRNVVKHTSAVYTDAAGAYDGLSRSFAGAAMSTASRISGAC